MDTPITTMPIMDTQDSYSFWERITNEQYVHDLIPLIPTYDETVMQFQDHSLQGPIDVLLLKSSFQEEEIKQKKTDDVLTKQIGYENDNDDNMYDGPKRRVKVVDIIIYDVLPYIPPPPLCKSLSPDISQMWYQTIPPLMLPLVCFVRVNLVRKAIVIHELDELHGERYLLTTKGSLDANSYTSLKDDVYNTKIYPTINRLMHVLKPYYCNAWKQVYVDLVHPETGKTYEFPIDLMRCRHGGPGFQRSPNWSIKWHNDLVFQSAVDVPPKKSICLLSND
jgi:hypothetical protein